MRSSLEYSAGLLRTETGGLFVSALIVGLGAGLGAVVFRYLIFAFTLLFTGHRDYTVLGHVPHPGLEVLGAGFVVFVPVVGALVYGPLIDRFAHEARGHGVPEVMLAVAEKGGRIRPRVAVIKSLASALCIGSGGSVGREGPIVQIGSALGSTLGQLLRLPDDRLRLLVACGAAGGISATFNAPIAGVFFALEIILMNFEVRSFATVVVASVAADAVGRTLLGTHPLLLIPSFGLVSSWEYALYGLLGVIAAFAGIAFMRTLYGMEDVVDRIWHAPEWLRPVAAGLPLGLTIFLLPEMYGVGYPVIDRIINGHYVAWFLLALLAGKMFASSLTLSGGGSGGVFAPSLFMGAALGTAFGDMAHRLFPAATAAGGAYGLVGMAAVFAAAARAPITAVLIVFEITGDYRMILPLMLAVAVSTALGNRLSRDTIYTLKLRRRGIEIMAPSAIMRTLKVDDAMRPVLAIGERVPASELAGLFKRADACALPIVDDEGAYRGILTVKRVSEALRRGRAPTAAGALADRFPALPRHERLLKALDVLSRLESSGGPVVDQSDVVVGWAAQRDMISLLSRRFDMGAGGTRRVRSAPEEASAAAKSCLPRFRVTAPWRSPRRGLPPSWAANWRTWRFPPASSSRRSGETVALGPPAKTPSCGESMP